MSGHSVVAGTTCLLTTTAGADVTGRSLDGFFVDDCRHVSRLVLRAAGAPLRVLRGGDDSTVCVPETARHDDPPYAVIRRRRVLPGSLTESLELTSFVATPQRVELGFEVAADFADQFELRSARTFDKSDAVRDVEVAGDHRVPAHGARIRSRISAAVQLNSSVPWPAPVSGS